MDVSLAQTQALFAVDFKAISAFYVFAELLLGPDGFAFGASPGSMIRHAFPPGRGKVFGLERPFRSGSFYSMALEA